MPDTKKGQAGQAAPQPCNVGSLAGTIELPLPAHRNHTGGKGQSRAELSRAGLFFLPFISGNAMPQAREVAGRGKGQASSTTSSYLGKGFSQGGEQRSAASSVFP